MNLKMDSDTFQTVGEALVNANEEVIILKKGKTHSKGGIW